MKIVQGLIADEISESIKIKEKLNSIEKHILEASMLVTGALKKKKKILLCGNGGSASDAQHIAAELMVRYKKGNDRDPLPAISLALDPSFMTAASNDLGYEEVFSRGVHALGEKEDVLIGISTSGNSKNIIRAVQKAVEKKMKIILLLGKDGGKLKGMGDVELKVPSKVTARIQECHILIGHIICRIVEHRLFGF